MKRNFARGPARLYARLMFVVFAALVARAPAHAERDALSLVADTWTRHRSVKTEREESEILLITAP